MPSTHPQGGDGTEPPTSPCGTRRSRPSPETGWDPAADGGARGPACQGSATGGDVFAHITHRGEQCGRAGGQALCRAKAAIKYLP